MDKQFHICVIGLGYVGLPLARLFSTKFTTIGFDQNQKRVDEINQGHDSTKELSDELLRKAVENNGMIFIQPRKCASWNGSAGNQPDGNAPRRREGACCGRKDHVRRARGPGRRARRGH